MSVYESQMDEAEVHSEELRKPKNFVQNPESVDDDLISNLPVEVLCHILSFLPMKSALCTSILSSKWKNLFPLIPNLKLDFDDSLPLLAEPKPDEVVQACFSDFVGRVLNRLQENAACIREFNLVCRRTYEDERIISWVSAAVRLGVQCVRLDAAMSDSSSSKLIGSLNGCTSLVRLILGSDFHLFVPDLPVLKFSNLKTLILQRMTLSESMESLFDGCPVLQSLVISSFIKYVSNFRICIRSLKSLVLYCRIHRDTVMVIDAPNLEVLYYVGLPGVNYSLISKFNCILGLCLAFRLQGNEHPNYDEHKVADLINACSKVEVLDFEDSTMEVLYHMSLPLPKFCNLKRVRVNVMGMAGWSVLGRLLRSASNLETLVIGEKSYMVDGCFASFWLLAGGCPGCLSSTMKIIIRSFKGQKDEIEFVKYILENGKVLEKVVMECDFNWKENWHVLDRITVTEVKSETCNVTFGKKAACDDNIVRPLLITRFFNS